MTYQNMLIERYGETLGREINDYLRNFTYEDSGYEYVDNVRVAWEEDPYEVQAYYRAQRSGCCGFYDETVVFQGLSFLIGFNYGH